MSEWKQDWGVLRHGDERWKREAGRVMMLIVERASPHGGDWIARTSNAKHCLVQLTRKFVTKEEAMRAIEKKAARMMQDAIEELAKEERERCKAVADKKEDSTEAPSSIRIFAKRG